LNKRQHSLSVCSSAAQMQSVIINPSASDESKRRHRSRIIGPRPLRCHARSQRSDLARLFTPATFRRVLARSPPSKCVLAVVRDVDVAVSLIHASHKYDRASHLQLNSFGAVE
jgi:hypothetical protein